MMKAASRGAAFILSDAEQKHCKTKNKYKHKPKTYKTMTTKNKFLAFGLIAALAMCNAKVQADAPSVPVILTAGQSNADGRVPIADLPDYVDFHLCQWSYGSGDFASATGHFSPFSPHVAKPGIEGSWGFDAIVYHLLGQCWQRPFYVIKQTMGGTSIDTSCQSTHGWHWSVDAEQKSLLKALCRQIDDCVQQLPPDYEIKCLLWHQGESDRAAADRYHDNLKAVVDHVRRHLVETTGRKEYATLPVVCATYSDSSRQKSDKIVAALLDMQREDGNFHVVDASDLSLLPDRLHFDAEGAERLAGRIFAKMQEIGIAGNCKP